MVKSKSTARLLDLSDVVILTQTDTTVGFLSQNSKRLSTIKLRPAHKPFIKVFTSLHVMHKAHKRVPNLHKNRVRRAKKTTFIVKNEAFRVARHVAASEILRRLEWVYSTSANESSKSFARDFCTQKADIIIEDSNGLSEKAASSLMKINNTKIKRLR